MSARLLKSSDIAELLGVSESALCRWRKAKKGPPYVDVEGNPRYRSADLYDWLEKQTRLRDAA